jgi:integrase
MSIFKRGKFYWYKFMWDGKLIRESTKQGNDKIARNMESAHRTSLAQGLVGIREKKEAPTLEEFCKKRIEPWAKATFQKPAPKTWLWYCFGLKALRSYKKLADLKLDEIGNEQAADFAAFKQADEWQVSTINSALRALRRVLRLAVEWGEIPNAPKIKFLAGENHRERIITPKDEQKYLEKAAPLLHDVATVLLDTGMRPDECHHLTWENVNWDAGRFGTILITRGKTKAARRLLPMTPRVRTVLELRWEGAEKPASGWIWPANTRSGHMEHDTLRVQHKNALAASKVRPFVIYSFRHTFLTRLGESGCDAWTLARIAGHSNIAISQRYVHPSEDAVLSAMSRLGGHKTGHTEKTALPPAEAKQQVTESQ